MDYSRFDNLDVSDSDDEKHQNTDSRGPAPDSDVLAELPRDLPEDLALVLAAREGQQHLVEALLKKGVSVNSADPHGGTALLRAVEAGVGNRCVIELLLRRRASLESKSSLGDSPMNIAAAKGPVPLCEALMDAGGPSSEVRAAALLASAEKYNETTSQYLLGPARAPPNARGIDKRTALHHWAKRGHVGLVQALLVARADASASDINGVTPLICATQGGSDAVVKTLCQHGALVNHAEPNGTTALTTAVGVGAATKEQQAAELVKVLLEYQAMVEAVSVGRGPSPLVAAACANRKSIVAVLLQARAAVNVADGSGRRALPCAAAVGTLELCEFLLRSRAEVNGRSTNGSVPEPSSQVKVGVTALSIAAASDKIRLVEVLLAASADPETTDERGNTPLISAASKGSLEICSMLLAVRASVNSMQASSGKTALLLAASSGHGLVCSTLLAAGADLFAKADSGAAPLHAAAANGHEAVCRILLEARAAPGEVGPARQDAVALALAAGHSSLSELLRVGPDIGSYTTPV